MTAIIPILIMIGYIALLVYFISLASRLVRAVERIADKIDGGPLPRVQARVVEPQ